MEIEQGVELLLKEIRAKEKTVSVPVSEACGMVCAAPVYAPMMVPHFPKSAMDGYAAVSGEVCQASPEHPVTLKVLGELCAGEYQEYHHEKQDAVKVMTGAYIPEGFDCVVRQEDTDYGEETVTITRGVAAYTNYCRIGEDIREGELVIAQGTRLLPLHIGLLVSLGITHIAVYEPLKVAIISTGTELLEPGEELQPGKIYNSIRFILAAAMEREGFGIPLQVSCPDDQEQLTAYLQKALAAADIIITTGGVSVGKRDIVPEVLQTMGARKLFQGINVQPGTPTLASVLENKIVLSLSGNPYAALVNFDLYLWPMAAKYMHSKTFETVRGTAVLDSDYPKVNPVRRLVRAYAEGGRVRIPSQLHASSVIRNLTQCNCFIDIRENTKIHKGDTVCIHYIK